MLCVWQISFPSPRRISLLAPSTAWAGTAGFALPYLHRSFGLMETLHSPAKSRCGLHDAGMFGSAIQPAGTLPATTPTSPHCSGQKMQASVAISQGEKNREAA